MCVRACVRAWVGAWCVCDGLLLWIQVEVAEKNAEDHAAALLREEQEKNQKAERRRAKNKKVCI